MSDGEMNRLLFALLILSAESMTNDDVLASNLAWFALFQMFHAPTGGTQPDAEEKP